MKTVDISETIAASDLKFGRSFVDLGPRSCTYKNSNWIFSETTVLI